MYAHFGLALYLAQVLEHGIVNALLFLELIPQRAGKPVPRREWEAEFDSFLERNFQATFGKMIRNLQAVTTVPSDLETMLADALRKRDFLAHHFFRERSDDFISHQGREKMVEELEASQATFAKADERLSEVTKAVRDRYGLTNERIDEFLKGHLGRMQHDL